MTNSRQSTAKSLLWRRLPRISRRAIVWALLVWLGLAWILFHSLHPIPRLTFEDAHLITSTEDGCVVISEYSAEEELPVELTTWNARTRERVNSVRWSGERDHNPFGKHGFIILELPGHKNKLTAYYFKTGQQIPFPMYFNHIRCSVSPDGKWLAAVETKRRADENDSETVYGRVVIFNLLTWQEHRPWPKPPTELENTLFRFSSNSRFLLTEGMERTSTYNLYDVESGRKLRTFSRPFRNPRFSEDAKYVAYFDETTKSILSIELATGATQHLVSVPPPYVSARIEYFGSDGRLVALLSKGKSWDSFAVWDAFAGTLNQLCESWSELRAGYICDNPNDSRDWFIQSLAAPGRYGPFPYEHFPQFLDTTQNVLVTFVPGRSGTLYSWWNAAADKYSFIPKPNSSRQTLQCWDLQRTQATTTLINVGESCAPFANNELVVSFARYDSDTIPIRVWDFPIRRPWLRIIGWSAAPAFIVLFIGWIRGRRAANPATMPNPT